MNNNFVFKKKKGSSLYLPVGPECALYHAYWDQTAIDHSIHGNHGTLVDNAHFDPEGVVLDATDDAVSVPNSPSLYPGVEDYSIEAWLRPLRKASGGMAWLFYGENFTDFVYFNAAIDNADPQYKFVDPGDFSTMLLQQGDPEVTDYYVPNGLVGKSWEYPFWRHIIYAIDRDVGGIVYVDGAIPAGVSIGGALYAPAITWENDPFLLGDAFLGRLGEFRIWKKFLTEADALWLYNATCSRYVQG
jgi:hypothetical protein